jgi:periplasmic protein TonB
MKRRLFEDLVVSVSGKKPRGRLALPVSVTLHAAGVAALLALPALTTEALPDPPPSLQPPMVATVHIAQPPPPQAVDARPRPAGSRPRRTTANPVPRGVDARPRPDLEAPLLPNDDTELPSIEDGGAMCLGCQFGEATDSVGHDARPGGEDGSGDAPVPVGRLIRPPTKVREARPVYPEIARISRVQGAVQIECVIAPDGRVVDLRVVSGNPLFQEAAMDAVRQWRYTPSMLNGVPVAVIMTVTVHFILH